MQRLQECMRRMVGAMVVWTALAAPGWAQTVSNGGFEAIDASGMAIDWASIGGARIVTDTAHTGQRSLHLHRPPGTPGEIGANRAWTPGTPDQGAMLSQTRGAIAFWYRTDPSAPPFAAQMHVIPMSSRAMELPFGRVIWVAPDAAAEEQGQWRRAIIGYDFSANPDVKWIMIAPRLGLEAENMWIDDVEWLPDAPAALQIERVQLRPSGADPDSTALLQVIVRGTGTSPTSAATLRVSVTESLHSVPPSVSVPALKSGATHTAEIRLTGKRVGEVPVTVSVDLGDRTVTRRATLQPRLQVSHLECSAMQTRPGQPVRVRLFVSNTGDSVAPDASAWLQLPSGMTARRIRSGGPVSVRNDVSVAEWEIQTASELGWVSIMGGLHGDPHAASAPLWVTTVRPRVQDDAKPAVRVSGDQAVVSTGVCRLAMVRGADGLWWGQLQTRRGAQWRTVGLLPRLGLLSTAGHDLPFRPMQAVARGRELRFHGAIASQGVTWRVETTISAQPGADWLSYTVRATPDKPASYRALEGPMLYAGEGVNRPRQDAIVPGLEWLDTGEESSSALDILPDHPDRNRTVPHPYKVTIPAVGLRQDGALVGLLWDAWHKQLSPKHGPASVVFSSPNRLEGHRNHLMGLQLPAVGPDMRENTRRAIRDIPVQPGETLALHAVLQARDQAKEALEVIDRWLALNGRPAPLAPPHGSWRNELAFNMSGYAPDTALWNPEWRKWYTDLIIGFAPSLAPVPELVAGAEVLGDHPMSHKARSWVSAADFDQTEPMAIHAQHRTDTNQLEQMARTASGLVRSQLPDGNWPFGGKHAGAIPPGSLDYDYLGPEGACESGLTAAPATTVLQYALLTGDRQALAGGLKALEALTRYSIPRAAQTWEVPVHTPDILAAGYCVRANVLGYRLTGDPRWLQQARLWARRVLPFMYVWHPRDLPAMHGASIPVFGATHYSLSWFGVAVQWNGIACADPLYELDAVDPNPLWRWMADMLYRSGMYQQERDGDRIAMWPDALNLVPIRSGSHGTTPPCFTPSSLLNHTLNRLGWITDLRTDTALWNQHRVTVRARAQITALRIRGNTVVSRVDFGPHQRGGVELFGVSQPTQVLLNGQSIEQRDALWTGQRAGWRWHARWNLLEVRVPAPGAHLITVEGVQPSGPPMPPQVRQNMDFSFAQDSEGWQPTNQISELRTTPRGLEGTMTGGDPYLVRPDLMVTGKPGDTLVLQIAVTQGDGAGTLFWATSAGGIDPLRSIEFGIPMDGALHTIRIPVGAHAQWAGHTIEALRIDPGSGPAGARFVIRSVRLERADGTSATDSH